MSGPENRVTIGEIFLKLHLDKNVRIIDIACGTGAVAEELIAGGYNNIDGLDPRKGYLAVAREKSLYRNDYATFVEPSKKLPIEDNTYDVMVCCAGFFEGLMSPFVLPELVRITKPGGFLIWNIAEEFEFYGKDFESYDQIIDELRASNKWEYHCPVQRLNQIVFTDSGAAYLGGYHGDGLATQGFIYTMKKL
jgi:ubiquinone/menaquinone biosynthesis C-methylase UbiE